MWRKVATQRKKSVVFSERFYADFYSAERVLLKFLKDFVPVEDIKWRFVLWEFYCLTESPHLNITTNSYINNADSLFSQTFQRTSSPYFIFRWKKHVLLPTWVRNASVGRNLVEQDTERPDVGLVGELPVADGLRSAPLVGDLLVFWDVKRLLDEKKCVLKKKLQNLFDLLQTCADFSSLCYLDHSGQSKVGHLTGVVFSHQDVSGRQVSVDAVLLLQVRHPISHLGGHVNEWCDVLILALRTWNGQTIRPQRVFSFKAPNLKDWLKLQISDEQWNSEFTSEEAEQAALLHQLRDDPVRRRWRAHSKQRDEVTMTETLQDLNFPLKLSLVQLRVWVTDRRKKNKKPRDEIRGTETKRGRGEGENKEEEKETTQLLAF